MMRGMSILGLRVPITLIAFSDASAFTYLLIINNSKIPGCLACSSRSCGDPQVSLDQHGDHISVGNSEKSCKFKTFQLESFWRTWAVCLGTILSLAVGS
ncbi:hypothetical protein BGZ60DRAFT_253251 [Tricladium varicosporioides]|nr:hypothetical protein BGZ60DRAFT_253251 [Hymenoscyphus varicosporioides]